MTNKSGRTRQTTNNLKDELIWKMSLIGSPSSGFAQNTIHDFLKYRIVALSFTNATKMANATKTPTHKFGSLCRRYSVSPTFSFTT